MNKAVIFDMDGVIFDSEAMVLACWKIIAETYGIPGIDEVFSRCIGTNSAETKRIIEDYYGEDFDYEHFREKASALFQEKTKRSAREARCEGTSQLSKDQWLPGRSCHFHKKSKGGGRIGAGRTVEIF